MKNIIACLVLLATAVLSAVGCGSGDCPSRTVTLDGGMDGLPDIGASATRDVCLLVCGTPGCRRETEVILTCFPTCE